MLYTNPIQEIRKSEMTRTMWSNVTNCIYSIENDQLKTMKQQWVGVPSSWWSRSLEQLVSRTRECCTVENTIELLSTVACNQGLERRNTYGSLLGQSSLISLLLLLPVVSTCKLNWFLLIIVSILSISNVQTYIIEYWIIR